jgi:hypothetical protein
MSACFLTRLDVSLVDGCDDRWKLDSPLVYFSEIVGEKITVPSGFDTDFASVPRVPVFYLLYANRGKRAATVHDFLYRNRLFDRATCDAVFREALIAGGEGVVVSWAMWAGVRIGGFFLYKGDRGAV